MFPNYILKNKNFKTHPTENILKFSLKIMNLIF